LFITFEGIEGCGKSTQARRLADRLTGMGVEVVLTLEPGGTRIGQDIRQILLSARNHDLSPLAELLLYEADRAQHVAEVIRPALGEGKWVVCDRFYDATAVYQGVARGQDMGIVRLLNDHASGRLRPDRTFLLDCPVEIGLKRAFRRNAEASERGQDRFEREDGAFHAAVRQGYLRLAAEEPDRFVVVDGTLREEPLENDIWERLKPMLPLNGKAHPL